LRENIFWGSRIGSRSGSWTATVYAPSLAKESSGIHQMLQHRPPSLFCISVGLNRYYGACDLHSILHTIPTQAKTSLEWATGPVGAEGRKALRSGE
jgi:hypothetical protein